MQQSRLLTLVNIQSASGPVAGQFSVGGNRLIHISTLEARQPLEVMGDYASAKAAMATMSVHLSKVFAQTGITSNVVSPGIIVTDAVKAFFRKLAADRGWAVDPADWAVVERRILDTEYPIAAGRLGLPRDVADAVAFLASPRTQYINAAHLMIDGGLVGTVV
jgi:3-oxoacyl-[acyl-carrier protein] reductase